MKKSKLKKREVEEKVKEVEEEEELDENEDEEEEQGTSENDEEMDEEEMKPVTKGKLIDPEEKEKRYTPEKRKTKGGKTRKKYTEGWIEMKSKSEAKRIALSINNTPVCAGRRSAATGALWNCKYLSGFKWIHLTEQLAYEKKLEEARMRSEINQAKKVAEHFAEQIEKGKHLKRLEEKVLKKRGVWEEFKRDINQRKVISKKKTKKTKPEDGDALMKMIFADD